MKPKVRRKDDKKKKKIKKPAITVEGELQKFKQRM